MGITLPPISTHGPQLSSLVADCETEAGTEHEHNEEGSHDWLHPRANLVEGELMRSTEPASQDEQFFIESPFEWPPNVFFRIATSSINWT